MGNIWNCIKLAPGVKDGKKVCSIKNKEGSITYFEEIPEEELNDFLRDIEKKAKKEGKTANEYLDRQIGVIEEFKKLKSLKVANEYLGIKQAGLIQSFKIENNLFKINNKLADGYLDYVILQSGEMKIGKGHYFLSNQSNEVLAAGKIELKAGKIDYIDNWSGHYRPDVSNLIDYVNIFQNQKLLSKTVEIRKVN